MGVRVCVRAHVCVCARVRVFQVTYSCSMVFKNKIGCSFMLESVGARYLQGHTTVSVHHLCALCCECNVREHLHIYNKNRIWLVDVFIPL
jgi:hypothetical protein